MTFSIIVVCLNAGEKLRETIDSIRSQTEQDYEVIIKDGGSVDEATVKYLDDDLKGLILYHSHQFCLIREKDEGIYDAMNQALKHVQGDYVFFLNCGDTFYDKEVLSRVRERIEKLGIKLGEQSAYGSSKVRQCIFYGDIYERLTNTLVKSNPSIDDFACYRNLPCHQACFYDAGLLHARGFDTAYAVRADYEHFLWCYYTACAKTVYMPITVARYEGGGFSESRENEKRSRREHREIVRKYMPASKVRRYRLIMALTLAPVRTWIAKNPVTAGIYQTIKRKLIYRNKSR
ncbi:MAG: glycosyltransferase [Lachnospiraceae bacterium]|nr:glycosyltransferase [Lachnospiraceae bacterium]